MNKKRIYLSILAVCLAIISCNLPTGQSVGVPTLTNLQLEQTITALASGPQVTATTPAPTVPGATLTPSATPCSPMVTANSSVNVRNGPGTVYDAVGALSTGGTASVAGKSNDGTWWYIVFPAGPGGYGWVSASVVTAACIPDSLAVIAAPPTPKPVSGTCMPGFTWRLINSSDKVCVPPASKTQAQADDAAAASRKIVNVYGVDACISGYVWREAFTNDHVCVTPDVRSQAAADNAAAASRWVSGAYGPHTCISGYVWREATSGDDVCVTPDVRTQAAADNAAAASRKAVNVYGMDACVSGYVWREAFSGDDVCVTPAVRSQTAADNAAAPSHTWP